MLAALPLPYPFELSFMQRALLAGVAVGAFAPLIGTFLVQRRMSLIGDGIGHLAFAGVAIGVVSGVHPLWTALAVSGAGALGLEYLRSRRKASGDLALALFFYSGIALGIVLLSRELEPTNIMGYLFGQILTVNVGEVATIVGVSTAVVVGTLAVRRTLFAVVADEEWARVAGLPVGPMNTLVAATTAVTVVASMRAVGILLVAGLMVLPVASAQLLARSFRGTLIWASTIGIASVVVGLAASRLWDVAPGGMIVLVAAGTFATVTVASSTRARAHGKAERATASIDGPDPAIAILADSHSADRLARDGE
jgi:zinc transport system permease protein